MREQHRTRSVASPDGRATLVHVDRAAGGAHLVLLIAGADTTTVLDSTNVKGLGVDWLSADLGRVWVPFGNHTYAVVYAEPSSGRVSPPFEFGVAVDAGAQTAVTLDPDAVTLRSLWSGGTLATWVPAGVSIYDLRHECEPSFSLSGRRATVRYDCGGGAEVKEAAW